MQRNERKRDALTTFMNTKTLEFVFQERHVVPYRLFYVGINLEHAFYDFMNCSAYEKESLSLDFDDVHARTLADWIDFVESLPCYGDTYQDSCRYARMRENAFKRMTNLKFVVAYLDELLSK